MVAKNPYGEFLCHFRLLAVVSMLANLVLICPANGEKNQDVRRTISKEGIIELTYSDGRRKEIRGAETSRPLVTEIQDGKRKSVVDHGLDVERLDDPTDATDATK